jgi:hypothetical protein
MLYEQYCTSKIIYHLSENCRDVPDLDTGKIKRSGTIQYKFAGYLPDSTIRYFVTTMKRKSLLGIYKL